MVGYKQTTVYETLHIKPDTDYCHTEENSVTLKLFAVIHVLVFRDIRITLMKEFISRIACHLLWKTFNLSLLTILEMTNCLVFKYSVLSVPDKGKYRTAFQMLGVYEALLSVFQRS